MKKILYAIISVAAVLSLASCEKLLTVSSGRVTIPFFTQDTDYTRGLYYWCLRLLYANGDVYTPMEKPQEFRILAVAGDASGGDDNGE